MERTESGDAPPRGHDQARRCPRRRPSSPTAAAAATTAAASAAAAAPTAARSASCWCRATSGRAPTTRSRRTCAGELAGLPGVIVRANPAGGNFQLTRLLGGGNNNGRQPPVARDPRPRPRRRAARRAGRSGDDGGHARHRRRRVGRDEGRPGTRRPRRPPEGRHARPDGQRRRHHDSDQRRRARRPRSSASAATSTRSSSGCAQADREEVADVGDVLAEHADRPGRAGARTCMAVDRETRPGADRAQEHGAHRHASTPRPRCR